MVDPGSIAAIVSAIASIAGPMLGTNKQRESPQQKQQRFNLDNIMQGLQGQGEYSKYFSTDYDTFQKSYVDPMKHKFENQIAPQIQQSFIADGQHRGTGMQNALTRAGVDMDQNLNEAYGQMQENAMNRGMSGMGLVNQANSGIQPGPPRNIGNTMSGFAASDSMPDLIEKILGMFNSGNAGASSSGSPSANAPYSSPTPVQRPGYEFNYNYPGSGRR